jgi:hypothetical protein
MKSNHHKKLLPMMILPILNSHFIRSVLCDTSTISIYRTHHHYHTRFTLRVVITISPTERKQRTGLTMSTCICPLTCLLLLLVSFFFLTFRFDTDKFGDDMDDMDLDSICTKIAPMFNTRNQSFIWCLLIIFVSPSLGAFKIHKQMHRKQNTTTFLHDCNFFVIIFYTSYLFPHTFMTYKCWTILCTI